MPFNTASSPISKPNMVINNMVIVGDGVCMIASNVPGTIIADWATNVPSAEYAGRQNSTYIWPSIFYSTLF